MPSLLRRKSKARNGDSNITPIPEPPALPWLGHIAEFKSEDSLQDLTRLHEIYGDIYRLRFPEGKSYILLGSNKLVNEVCDETRFQKSINNELWEVRNLANDGLFTAKLGEENWGIAHRVLMPAFGPVNIRGMFDEMYDIATQLALKWARHGPSQAILAADDFTRLAFDTIALCSMDFRFNSFYRDTAHPFISSMGDVLTESGKRFQRPSVAKVFYRAITKKYFQDIKMMREVADEVVSARRANSDSKKKDLLAAMMNGVDPKTGKKMNDVSITDNLITFLVAGHETTSGTLSFLFYSLLKNPDCYQKAQKEVDDIMGKEPITVEKIFKLRYIPAALRETLRVCSPIPGVAMEALKDTLLDYKYPIAKGDVLSPFLTVAHLDPRVFGEDAHLFRPERMLDENFERLQKEHPNCWKPFGNGVRACIGRPFAWQEMLLAVALLLQNFNFSMDDPGYNLRIAETLTVKPKDFYIRAALRHGMSPLDLEHKLRGTTAEPTATTNGAAKDEKHEVSESDGKRISIFYGSNSGTCESLAQRLAADAASHGFTASCIESLDVAKENLPTNQPVVIITSSYEGQPPDNAAHFVSWLKNLEGKPLDKVSYAVFGVGHREWSATFHKVPKLVNTELQEHGAKRVAEIGLTDTSDRDPFTDFETWEDNVLWPALQKEGPVSEPKIAMPQTDLSVCVSMPRSSTLRQDVNEAIVTATRDLSGPGVPLKKHFEIALPSEVSYRAGDYLCILPINPRETVSRVFRHFKLSWDAVLTIEGEKRVALPMSQPTSAWNVLSAYVELAQPATKRNILSLAEYTLDAETKRNLRDLAGDKLQEEVTKKRVSVMDLLERFPKIELPLAPFLTMLPPMRIRQYSIASSPLKSPHHVSVTYSILDEPSLSGQGRHIGVATNYLSNLSPNDLVHVAIRPSHVAFHLPLTPETTPIICVAAGAGVGPFRAFIEERAQQMAAGRKLAPALLFFGCRGKTDDLYREEFDAWEKQGAVVVKRAYSRETSEETKNCKYVQHRMVEERHEVAELWDRGAKLYVCGSRDMGKAVEEACVGLLKELNEMSEKEAREFVEEVRNQRFATDVFT
ncbi:cytochrome P450 [Fusarium solani]|uniref:Bifunctional cytochrome P450/NADPH--P450 reductase n=1 Tax=Fusarium solani TaxID=169388 RepID=A0A9P9K7N6_FUSSL|nr:cytochrome P450 [Fusarium solani]KAH7243014.1 cytochrome P450 [Fusarium solani]